LWKLARRRSRRPHTGGPHLRRGKRLSRALPVVVRAQSWGTGRGRTTDGAGPGAGVRRVAARGGRGAGALGEPLVWTDSFSSLRPQGRTFLRTQAKRSSRHGSAVLEYPRSSQKPS